MTDETSFAKEEEEEAVAKEKNTHTSRLTDVGNNISCIVHIHNMKCLR